jgi:methylglyoxal synthase
MKLRFGLAANRRHHERRDSAVSEWLRACSSGIADLGIEFVAVGRTCDAVQASGLLPEQATLIRYPYGRDGGLRRLVSLVAGGTEHTDQIDGAIYFIDPVDASSTFPEALALKRQCVTHKKPFISTLAGAKEWIEIERIHAAMQPDTEADRYFDLQDQTIALIAHDALKPDMMKYAGDHFALLSQFKRRVATGTTGKQLNELAWAKGWPMAQDWVDPYLSGPLGGDAQIAELVLDGHCQRVIFFEDPHVARQHEADIQLLERAVCTVGSAAVCANSSAMASRWAQALERRQSLIAAMR